jgi:HlyD family secretion protein
MNVLRTIAKVVVWLAVLGGLAAAGVHWGPGLYREYVAPHLAKNESKAAEVRFHTVARGTLRIGIVENGNLRAVKHHKLGSELRGSGKIAWVIAEGTQVKKGDKLLEFEKKPMEENLKQKEADLEAADREQTVAEEGLKIEDSSSKSMVAAAETHLKDAKEAQKKYRELEAPQQFKTLEAATAQAREKLVKAEQTLSEARRKAQDEMFIEEEQKKALEQQVVAAKDAAKAERKGLDAALLQQKMFKAYDYPRTYESKKQAVANAELDLAKARVAARSQMLQKDASLAHIKDNSRRLTREIEEQKKELEKCVLTAPVDGIVLYGDPEQRGIYYGGRGEMEIKVGAEWYRGNTLLTIPDLSAFEAGIAINEEYRGRLQPGCKATVTIEAVPGLVLEGKLKKIANLARPRIPWDEASPKVFDGVIELPQADPRMVSGMTARVEIVADTVENVLLVPVETVFNDQGETVCYVRNGSGFDRRCVKAGPSNNDFVQITEGLKEGEQVYVFNPTQGEAAREAGRPPG